MSKVEYQCCERYYKWEHSSDSYPYNLPTLKPCRKCVHRMYQLLQDTICYSFEKTPLSFEREDV